MAKVFFLFCFFFSKVTGNVTTVRMIHLSVDLFFKKLHLIDTVEYRPDTAE